MKFRERPLLTIAAAAVVELVAIVVVPRLGLPAAVVTLAQQAFVIAAVVALCGRDIKSELALHPVAPATFVNYAALPFLIVIPLQLALGWSVVATLAPMSGYPLAAALTLIPGAPLAEELMFRGFLQSGLSKIGFWPAALVSSAAWAALHVGRAPLAMGLIFLTGLLFAFVLRRTGSLWTCIAAHALLNLEPAALQLFILK